MSQFNRRRFVKTTGSLLALSAASGTLLRPLAAAAQGQEPVKLGLLHSLSGTIAIAEASLVDAEKMAVDEINASGGIMGRKIEVVVEDGASENPIFAEKARKLLERDKCAAIIGCYTSASRKAVLPALARANGLLFYPTYYEGQEQDKHVIYPSQEATQSVIAAIDWMAREKGKTIFLVGSDYIYPRTCNKIAKATISKLGGKLAGEEYAPLGHTEFSSIINKIKAAKPDCIYSTVVGGSNVAFYKQLRAAGLDGSKITLLSTVVSENEIEGIGKDNAAGYYACMGYFQSLKNPANERFVKAFKTRYGQERVIGDPMEVAYNSVYLWKLAAEKAKTFDPEKVAAAAGGVTLDAPEGTVRVHATNHHVWKKVRVGRARADGQFDIVWESSNLIEPNPFPQL
ncbi:urea ABC transporter substrate-binding protein [Cupriavidus plantarum]|uniref:urea ABC transporter substrate-binding protein n=1 Tax=Cupriavidus plantarum TaxID=942865 RepID=UPI001B17CDFC|nr:urea ABC transporter substrate-binding protein [Cupriavidus plantarum]CAG2146000.1 Aliphatic amidase expression-regulating protein [Cupriavidus plantarum]SMR86653.1 amino acid/amide ABC transporter substrate-binding protein, HAAT family [Cupriavidus plantarum]